MATFEEAQKCPKCSTPGEISAERSLPRSKDKLVTLICKNSTCKWFNTTYVVQRRPDGSVPDPDTRPRVKDFPAMHGGLQVAQDMRDVEELLLRQNEQMRQPGGGEINRRSR